MDDSKSRNVKLTVRLTVEEHEELQDLAHTVRLPLADFIRRASLNRAIRPAPSVVPELNRRAYLRLGNLAANFEKLVPLLATNDAIAAVETDLISVVRQAIRSTQALRAELVGQTRP